MNLLPSRSPLPESPQSYTGGLPIRKGRHVPIGFRYDPERTYNALIIVYKILSERWVPVSGRLPEGPWRHQSFRMAISDRKWGGGSTNSGASGHTSSAPHRGKCLSAGLIRCEGKNRPLPMPSAPSQLPKVTELGSSFPIHTPATAGRRIPLRRRVASLGVAPGARFPSPASRPPLAAVGLLTVAGGLFSSTLNPNE